MEESLHLNSIKICKNDCVIMQKKSYYLSSFLQSKEMASGLCYVFQGNYSQYENVLLFYKDLQQIRRFN